MYQRQPRTENELSINSQTPCLFSSLKSSQAYLEHPHSSTALGMHVFHQAKSSRNRNTPGVRVEGINNGGGGPKDVLSPLVLLPPLPCPPTLERSKGRAGFSQLDGRQEPRAWKGQRVGGSSRAHWRPTNAPQLGNELHPEERFICRRTSSVIYDDRLPFDVRGDIGKTLSVLRGYLARRQNQLGDYATSIRWALHFEHTRTLIRARWRPWYEVIIV